MSARRSHRPTAPRTSRRALLRELELLSPATAAASRADSKANLAAKLRSAMAAYRVTS